MTLSSALRRLERRLAVGQFLDVWPPWAVAAVLTAGLAALACRLVLPAAAPYLAWLWLAPAIAVPPALFVCDRRAYRPEQIAALADSLGGGRGVLLTMVEKADAEWARAPFVERATTFRMPAMRPWRRLAPLAPASAFLAVALWLPQRVPAAQQGALADDIARDLTAAVAELKQQQLVTPEEEKKLEEEIEQIRRGADERVDTASWEAADAVRERIVAEVSAKQDAVKWAQDSLARYAAAAQAGAGDASKSAAPAAELAKALEQLAKSGLLADAPPELQRLLKGGKLPGDAKSLAQLTASLSAYLGDKHGRFGKLGQLGQEFGRFDPSEFPLGSDASEPGAEPGRGGVNRGRADAALTWGQESPLLDRLKARELPPGAPRSPDDWAPVVELPGAPQEAAVLSSQAAARRYAASTGSTAWRRTLAPRHHSALKKYFAK